MMSVRESEPYSRKMRRELPRLCEMMTKGVCALHLFGRSKSIRANREGGTGRCDDGHDWDNIL